MGLSNKIKAKKDCGTVTKLARRNTLKVMFVRGHDDIDGIKKADELAR